MDLSYFNPRSQNEPDFLANFVARHTTLDFFLRQLRLAQAGQPARHHLIVAPRGYGKTSLLRRIAVAVRTERDLSQRFIALSFREEQHNVISLDVFWRNCLQSLLEVREDEQAAEIELDQIEKAWSTHAPRQGLKREDQDGEPAWQEFRGRCAQLGRRPLLLIDNLDALLAGLDMNHQWGLRRILQSDDGPLLIAAASRYPESTHDPQAAFYEFFRVQTLDKLGDEEVMQCLRALATHRGEGGRAVLQLLDRDPGRISALNTLAGGNPRTLNVLYGVLESHMSADVLSQLSAMLDTFTGWYQARTEELPMQARAVFDALALNWDPMSAVRLGEITGLDTTAVSSQLSRLEKAGYVEAVALNRRGKGRNGYQVGERFFNIWYLMRNGPRRARQSIRFLTVFLQSCFSGAERRTMARRLLGDGQADPGYALALASSMRTGSLRQQLLDHAQRQSERLGQSEHYGTAIEDLRRLDDRKEPSRQDAQSALPEETIEELDRVIEQFANAADPALREPVARALLNKGLRLGQLGRGEQAIEAYDELVRHYADAAEPALREQVARALVSKGYRLAELGRGEQAIEAYDELLRRYANAAEPALREQVAWALVNKGGTLGQLDRGEQAIEVYYEVLRSYADAAEPALRETVAWALCIEGLRLGLLGRGEQEIEVYDELIRRYADAAEPALREPVARALVYKGYRLGELGRSEEAETAMREALALEPEANVGWIWNRLGNLLLDTIGDPFAALAAFEAGVSVSPAADTLASLHANCAYALALHDGDTAQAEAHAQQAMADGKSISCAGRHLLAALSCLRKPVATRWDETFGQIGKAVDCEDGKLWSDYLGDLQQVLWFIVSEGQGPALRRWMEEAQYPLRFAPLYHALVAVLDGEDHLLRINPETRQPAARIHQGIARRLKLYPPDGHKPEGRRRG